MAKVEHHFTKNICDLCAPLVYTVGSRAELPLRGWEAWWKINRGIELSSYLARRSGPCLGCRDVDVEYYAVLFVLLFKLKVAK